MKGVIYCIERKKTKKKYIGQRVGDLDKYWGSGVAITKAIVKYGASAFNKYPIEECNIDQLDEREIYYIAEYNTFKGYGYNLDSGGKGNRGYWNNLTTKEKAIIHQKRLDARPENFKDIMKQSHKTRNNKGISDKLKGRTYSPETLKKMSEAAKGRVQSKETKDKISQKLNGQTRTEEQKIRMSKAMLGKPKPPRTEEHKKKLRKPVRKLDSQGNFITLYDGVSLAGKENNISYSQISKVCDGKQSQAGGFKWEWVKLEV